MASPRNDPKFLNWFIFLSSKSLLLYFFSINKDLPRLAPSLQARLSFSSTGPVNYLLDSLSRLLSFRASTPPSRGRVLSAIIIISQKIVWIDFFGLFFSLLISLVNVMEIRPSLLSYRKWRSDIERNLYPNFMHEAVDNPWFLGQKPKQNLRRAINSSRLSYYY